MEPIGHLFIIFIGRRFSQRMERQFKLDRFGALIFFRGFPGIVAFFSAQQMKPFLAGTFLILSIWADVLLCRFSSKWQWEKNRNHVQIEGFIDFFCFIIAPVQFGFLFGSAKILIPFAAIFILAGIYRLARFNVEGKINGGYSGLPVTYNGYLFPLAALPASFLTQQSTDFLFCFLFLLLSFLMTTSSFTTPEV